MHGQRNHAIKAVRDALIVDMSGSNTLSIWMDHSNRTEDGDYYWVTNMNLIFLMVKGCQLSALQYHRVQPFDAMLKWYSIFLCCPTVLNETIEMHSVCINLVCKKELKVPVGSTNSSCQACWITHQETATSVPQSV